MTADNGDSVPDYEGPIENLCLEVVRLRNEVRAAGHEGISDWLGQAIQSLENAADLARSKAKNGGTAP